MDKADTNYDSLFSPSQWSKRMPKDVIIQHHINFITKYSQDVEDTIPSELDIQYGPGPRQLYNIIGSDLPADAPILVVVHGGYWQAEEITHRNMTYIARHFYKQKIKVIAIDYDLCPNVTLHHIINELQLAIKQCVLYARKMQSRGIYLLGHSAGAHLLASLFSQFLDELSEDENTLIKAIFLICGIYDISLLPLTTINEALTLSVDGAANLSPHLKAVNVPNDIAIYTVVAEHDAPALFEQGERFHKKLLSNTAKSTCILLEGDDHFSAMERLVEEDYKLTKLILDEIEKCRQK